MLKVPTYASFEVRRPLTAGEMKEAYDFLDTLLRTEEEWSELYARTAKALGLDNVYHTEVNTYFKDPE